MKTLSFLLLSSLTAINANRLVGFVGPAPDAVEIAARSAITSAPEQDHPNGGHYNLLRPRAFCKHDCDWDAFCVQNGAYGGCCANRYTTCNVATTCMDYTQHMGTISSYSSMKTIMCPSGMPYCTSTYAAAFSFDFVDCGFTSPTFYNTPRPTPTPTPTPSPDPETTSELTWGPQTTSPVEDDITANDNHDDGPTDDDVADKGGSNQPDPEPTKKKSKISPATIGGIAGGCLIVIIAVCIIFALRKRNKRKDAAANAPLMSQHSPGNPPPVYAPNTAYNSQTATSYAQPIYTAQGVYQPFPKTDGTGYPSPQPTPTPVPQYVPGYSVPPPPVGVVEAGGEAVQPPRRW